MYAVGGNTEAARMMGVNCRKTLMFSLSLQEGWHFGGILPLGIQGGAAYPLAVREGTGCYSCMWRWWNCIDRWKRSYIGYLHRCFNYGNADEYFQYAVIAESILGKGYYRHTGIDCEY